MSDETREENISGKCLLRVSARLNKLDRGYVAMVTEFRAHAKEMAGFVERDIERHRASEDAVVTLRTEMGEAHKLLHARVNSTLRVFWRLMMGVAGFIIITLLGIIAKVAYDGLPWRTKAEIVSTLFS